MVNQPSPIEKSSALSPPRPYVAQGTHPIETGRYLLPTNEIIRMYDTVAQWITNRSPGGMIYGRPRLGKSRAITYLSYELPNEFGNHLPIFTMKCRQYKQPSESSFFEDILNDVGHALPFNGKANLKRDRLYRYFVEKAERSAQKRIILFIDDAQRLFEIQYGWLMDIYNELDSSGISMTVILVGQEELVHQRSAFIQAKKAQIIGRFMVHEFNFKGIVDADDMAVCLSGYDNISEYPENSGWSFTRYFFPDGFDHHGCRLENCAKDLFSIFTNLRKEHGLTRATEIPMQYLTLTVENALRHFGANGEDLHWLNNEQWKSSITSSGYIEAETYHEVV
ncbi:AAA domain-containing protein [Paenibacillus algorifonticola]|uniref:AAA domain-containing protein n=1 Tax=Paenibacillus algorifonticola TaxID=684063 RepID=A0A1I1YYQ4_9BACL|nr:ATP-binding protein [Paenibacillus algorifonticola]SFE24422.1 AAA domain-containing protein [Paenibacillus algorifonticola]